MTDREALEYEIEDAMFELSDAESTLYRLEDEGLEGTDEFDEAERDVYNAENHLAYLQSLRSEHDSE
jgi:hypothetical protein